jgi:hypothetical protein
VPRCFSSFSPALPLHMSFGDLSWEYSLGSPGGIGPRLMALIRFLAVALGYSALIIAFFSFLGAVVGHYLKRVESLSGYGVNLAGGLAGMALFSLLALLHFGPATWILLGSLLLIPLLWKDRLAILQSNRLGTVAIAVQLGTSLCLLAGVESRVVPVGSRSVDRFSATAPFG